MLTSIVTTPSGLNSQPWKAEAAAVFTNYEYLSHLLIINTVLKINFSQINLDHFTSYPDNQCSIVCCPFYQGFIYCSGFSDLSKQYFEDIEQIRGMIG